jgi:predicted ATP-grasp superfamily ATP-dependent carboligase
MERGPKLLIIGASARAAAFSAMRAGLRPWAIDLFGDTDLQALCPTMALPPGGYPEGLVAAARQAPPMPWMYTGALENRPDIIRRITWQRPLWGNGPEVLRRVRSPWNLARLFAAAEIPFPAVRFRPGLFMVGHPWLIKPRAGAGGLGVRFWRRGPLPRRPHYFQRFVNGVPCAAVYVGTAQGALLLGVTRQLLGQVWLNTTGFTYCGSVGPLPLAPAFQRQFQAIGDVLTRVGGLRGVFGVDCVLDDETPWPIEVNPRYTASVEVVEYGTGWSVLGFHHGIFDPRAAQGQTTYSRGFTWGKAILFARHTLTFPAEGPWREQTIWSPFLDFADIPPAGQVIRAGRPVLTFFASARTEAGCLEKLRKTAADLDRRLFGR